MTTIIGIAGRARAGKDTIAEHLQQVHGFCRRAFADALKKAAEDIFGLSHEQLYGREKETVDGFWGRSPREMLQLLGTECLRQGYGQDVWVRALQRFIHVRRAVRDWVVPDVRFVNEAEAIRAWGGRLWLVRRPGLEAMGIVGHASEHDLDAFGAWDHVFENVGTPDDLCTLVDGVLLLGGGHAQKDND